MNKNVEMYSLISLKHKQYQKTLIQHKNRISSLLKILLKVALTLKISWSWFDILSFLIKLDVSDSGTLSSFLSLAFVFNLITFFVPFAAVVPSILGFSCDCCFCSVRIFARLFLNQTYGKQTSALLKIINCMKHQ